MSIYLFKPPYAIGSVPSLSGHAIACRWRSLPRVLRHRASKPQGSSKRLLPWQVAMDQLICASLSHTHYWYEVGMLKVLAYTVNRHAVAYRWRPLLRFHRHRTSSHQDSLSNGCYLFMFHHGPVFVPHYFPTPSTCINSLFLVLSGGHEMTCAIQNRNEFQFSQPPNILVVFSKRIPPMARLFVCISRTADGPQRPTLPPSFNMPTSYQ